MARSLSPEDQGGITLGTTFQYMTLLDRIPEKIAGLLSESSPLEWQTRFRLTEITNDIIQVTRALDGNLRELQRRLDRAPGIGLQYNGPFGPFMGAPMYYHNYLPIPNYPVVAGAAAARPNVARSETIEQPIQKCYKALARVDDPDSFIAEIKRRVNPVRLNVRISALKKINRTMVLMICPTEDEIQLFATAVQAQFPQVNVYTPRRLMPEIVIYGVDQGSTDDIRGTIVNITGEEPARIKIVAARYNRYKAFVRLSGGALKKVEQIDKKIICIGYNHCTYWRHVALQTCHKCWKFGHHITTCMTTNDDLIKIRYCKSLHKCVHCFVSQVARSNPEDYPEEQILAGIHHDSFARDCPVFMARKKHVAGRYDYED